MIYFDNAATTWPKPKEVYKSMERCMKEAGANPGRSGHQMAIKAAKIIYNTREALANLFGIKDSKNIVFTLNATDALNIGIKGLLKEGDHVIATSMEHNSVIRPLTYLSQNNFISTTIVNCNNQGVLNTSDIKNAIKKNTKLIVATHASNVTGNLMPIQEIGKIAKENNIIFMVDAAQTAGICDISVEKQNIDLLAFTGHKSLFGPQGTGGLCIREGLEIESLRQGGTGSSSESENHPSFLPDKFESGTPNTVGLAGLGAGVEFIQKKGLKYIFEYKKDLTNYLIEKLNEIEEIILYGSFSKDSQIPVVSFNINGIESSEASYILDQVFNIMSRPGLHCAPYAHKTIKTFPSGTIRFSLGYFNTKEEVDISVQAIKHIIGEKKR
ncbi:MAG: aminotransferase class V-fold PLP-dependent enzyme [bacterium]|nr:aminotransferase class V-fold PLP-dependent enzyme [bacterium]